MNAQGRFAIGWSTLLSSVSGKYLRLQQGPVYMRRYGSDGAPLALAQKVSDRQSGIAEVPLDPGALVPLYAAAAVELRYAAVPRSGERRGGDEGVRMGRSRWSPRH